ncbi:hypothetical protein LSAT2_004066 [Lamellibrachia satsuma]|nr:hypothetical protein LSAT2_004066 [Lamellibrachia satsuma]
MERTTMENVNAMGVASWYQRPAKHFIFNGRSKTDTFWLSIGIQGPMMCVAAVGIYLWLLYRWCRNRKRQSVIEIQEKNLRKVEFRKQPDDVRIFIPMEEHINNNVTHYHQLVGCRDEAPSSSDKRRHGARRYKLRAPCNVARRYEAVDEDDIESGGKFPRKDIVVLLGLA